MKMQAIITVEVESGCGEASLYTYLNDLVQDIERMKYDDWRGSINTDWEESYPVEINIDGKISK
jgi:hypothetical protein